MSYFMCMYVLTSTLTPIIVKLFLFYFKWNLFLLKESGILQRKALVTRNSFLHLNLKCYLKIIENLKFKLTWIMPQTYRFAILWNVCRRRFCMSNFHLGFKEGYIFSLLYMGYSCFASLITFIFIVTTNSNMLCMQLICMSTCYDATDTNIVTTWIGTWMLQVLNI